MFSDSLKLLLLLLFSCSVMCDSLHPHGLQHASLPRPSPTPGACSNSGPLSQWCHPTISSSVIPFSFCPRSVPASVYFPMSPIRWPKYWTFSFSISPANEYSGVISFRMDWLDLLAGQGTLKSLLQHHSSKASILQPSLWSTSHIHTYMTTGKNIVLTISYHISYLILSYCILPHHSCIPSLLLSI